MLYSLGGIVNVTAVTFGRYSSGIVGCIANVTLDTDYQIQLVTDAQQTVNVAQCDDDVIES